MRRIRVALALTLLLAGASVPSAAAQGTASCQPGQPATYVTGFADLYAR